MSERPSRATATSLLASTVAAATTTLVVITPIAAKDYQLLVRVLYAADLAEQVAAVCSVDDSLFLSETAGTVGDMHDYARHIRSEVIANLSGIEEADVSTTATESATSDLLDIVNRLSPKEPEKYGETLSAWCKTIARDFVRSVITTHDRHHEQIDRILAEAKRD